MKTATVCLVFNYFNDNCEKNFSSAGFTLSINKLTNNLLFIKKKHKINQLGLAGHILTLAIAHWLCFTS